MNGMLCCIFNYAPLYRQAIYSEIDREFDTQFCFGEEVIDGQGDAGIRQLDKTAFRHPVKKIRNRMLLRRHPWRSGILSLPFKKAYSTFLITGDLNWAYIPFLLLCRFFGKRVYGWGHGVKKMQGQTHFKRWFYNHLDGYFIYGEKGRERMRELGFDAGKIYVIYNSLTYSLTGAEDSKTNSAEENGQKNESKDEKSLNRENEGFPSGENENGKLGKVENKKLIEGKNKNSGRGEDVVFEDERNGKTKEAESNGRNVYREHFGNWDPTIIFSGRLTPAKRVEMLLNAVIRLNGEGVKCNLVIIGDGPERERLEKISISTQKPCTNNIDSQSVTQKREYQLSESGSSCMKNTDSQSVTQKREYQLSESESSCMKNTDSQSVAQTEEFQLSEPGTSCMKIQEGQGIRTGNVSEAGRSSSRMASRIWFYGECYEEERTAELLRDAAVCVSPGNVGLMAIHAMQCGTPVISHSNFETQMPEYEVIVEGNPNTAKGDCIAEVGTVEEKDEKNGESRPTGALFKEGDEDDLCRVLRDWLTKHCDDREQIRKNCREMIESHWTAKTQIAILRSVLK